MNRNFNQLNIVWENIQELKHSKEMERQEREEPDEICDKCVFNENKFCLLHEKAALLACDSFIDLEQAREDYQPGW